MSLCGPLCCSLCLCYVPFGWADVVVVICCFFIFYRLVLAGRSRVVIVFSYGCRLH